MQSKTDQSNQYIQVPPGYGDDVFIQNLFNQIENTNDSFFIMGKAGTGKSTFLQYLFQTSKKNIVVTAFTGIAAINVGGVTLHSLFMLPIKPFMPADADLPMFANGHARRRLIEKMDTLIIDEVSMVRADILEAIDYSLRVNGGNPALSFGGKQVILVGDIFQLPPVVDTKNATETELFSSVYSSPHFFGAPAYRRHEFNQIELTKIYRQTDGEFKDLLNKVRVGKATDKDINKLNYRHFGEFNPDDEHFTLTLATRNKQAAEVNERRMRMIESEAFEFVAKIEGEFSKDKYPNEVQLILKKDAQVIFIRNDVSGTDKTKPGGRRWVNGTIGKIHAIGKDFIEVMLENGEIYPVERAEWENKTFRLNMHEGRIKAETIGTFTQYPLKPAWAITIHKSQGLTFDKVIIDLGFGAFTAGQTYVALSRCRSLEGIILRRELRDEDIMVDPKVVEFYEGLFRE